MGVINGMVKIEFQASNLQECLIEQLTKTVPDVTFSPMVKDVRPYLQAVDYAKQTFINLEEVPHNQIKFLSDTHFGHTKIIQYCNRPFSSVEDMEVQIIEKYNSVVDKDDVVVFVGDVAFKNHNYVNMQILSKMNGYKILVLGNHDFYHHTKKQIPYDFDEIHLVLKIGNFVISHHPWWDVPLGWYNIHGHLHNKTTNNPQHFNVSVENINYTPISLEEIYSKLTNCK